MKKILAFVAVLLPVMVFAQSASMMAMAQAELQKRGLNETEVRTRLLEEIGGAQTFVTCTDESDLEGLSERRTYRVSAGPDGRARCRILLSHYPVLPDERPDLMLCGHTHGGQFNLLGLTPFAIGFERLVSRKPHARYIAGLHKQGGTQVLVTKGIGASRIPLRVGVRPEICLIRFD